MPTQRSRRQSGPGLKRTIMQTNAPPADATRAQVEAESNTTPRTRADDDAPRLIFSDWLEENGEPESAEFIRTQCALVSSKLSTRLCLGKGEGGLFR